MSIVSIRAALETALNAMSPTIATAWENQRFTPTEGVAYQRVDLLPAPPENPTYGATFKREVGLFQISLAYPAEVGSGAAATRAQLLKTTFARGNSYVSGGVTVTIERTPEIKPAFIDSNRYVVAVRIRYFSNIG